MNTSTEKLSLSGIGDKIRGNKTAIALTAAGLLLATAIGGCGSAEKNEPQANTDVSADPNATQVDAEPTQETTELEPMSEEDIVYTGNVLKSSNGSKNDINYRLDGRFGAYYPEVVGTEGACISKFEAALNYEHLKYAQKQYQNLKKQDPALFEYFQTGSYYNEIVRLELPAKALLVNAADDEDCPNGANSSLISFEHEGETLETSANGLLYWVGDAANAYGDKSFSYDEKIEGYDKLIKYQKDSIVAMSQDVTSDLGALANLKIQLHLTESHKLLVEKYYS